MSLDSPALSPETACAVPVRSSHPLTAADLLERVVAARDLDKRPFTPAPWLWHGYIGPGKVTLLTSHSR